MTDSYFYAALSREENRSDSYPEHEVDVAHAAEDACNRRGHHDFQGGECRLCGTYEHDQPETDVRGL